MSSHHSDPQKESINKFFNERKFKKLVTARLYGLLLFQGEVVFDPVVSKYWKLIDILTIVHVFVICAVGPSIFFLAIPPSEITVSYLLFGFMANSTFFGVIACDIIASGFASTGLKVAFKAIDDDFGNPLTKYTKLATKDSTEDEENYFHYKHFELNKNVLMITIPQLIFGLVNILARIVNFFLIDESSRRYELQYYIYPTFLVQYVNSDFKYILVYILEAYCQTALLLKNTCYGPFLYMITASFYNAFLNFILNIRADARELAKNLDEIQQMEYEGSKTKEILLEEYFKQFTKYMEMYQEFLSKIENLRIYLELQLVLFIFGSAVTIITLICFVALTVESICIGNKIATVMQCIFGVIILYENCAVGSVFQDLNLMLQNEIYNIPWYHFPPQQRKIIQTFLNVCQKPIEFKAAGIYPASMVTFPRVLNFCYATINFFRTTQLNK